MKRCPRCGNQMNKENNNYVCPRCRMSINESQVNSFQKMNASEDENKNTQTALYDSMTDTNDTAVI